MQERERERMLPWDEVRLPTPGRFAVEGRNDSAGLSVRAELISCSAAAYQL